jgi:hypothetical protein
MLEWRPALSLTALTPREARLLHAQTSLERMGRQRRVAIMDLAVTYPIITVRSGERRRIASRPHRMIDYDQ